MQKIGLVFLTLVVLMCGVVNAQKGIQPVGPPVSSTHDITIEDDATASYLIFDPVTGVYKFYQCSDGFSLSGTGVVKVNGCSLQLEDLQTGRRVLASVDDCTQVAKASVSTFALVGQRNTSDVTARKITLADPDMRDNQLNCTPKDKLQ
jgi:hypothetical protein